MATWEEVSRNPGDYLGVIALAFEEKLHGWMNEMKAMPPEAEGNPDLQEEWARDHQQTFQVIAQGFRVMDAVNQADREWDSPDFGIPGFSEPLPGQQCKGFRRKHSSVPVSDVPTRLGIPARLFRASPRVGRQAGKPAPGQSPP